VNVSAAKFLSVHDFSGSRLDEGRAAKKHHALILNDDSLIAHRWHIGATRGAGAKHHRDLWYAERAHRRLIVEESPEVLSIREYLILEW
jgi:hypothetical protein